MDTYNPLLIKLKFLICYELIFLLSTLDKDIFKLINLERGEKSKYPSTLTKCSQRNL